MDGPEVHLQHMALKMLHQVLPGNQIAGSQVGNSTPLLSPGTSILGWVASLDVRVYTIIKARGKKSQRVN